jgi:hypothetical protein
LAAGPPSIVIVVMMIMMVVMIMVMMMMVMVMMMMVMIIVVMIIVVMVMMIILCQFHRALLGRGVGTCTLVIRVEKFNRVWNRVQELGERACGLDGGLGWG